MPRVARIYSRSPEFLKTQNRLTSAIAAVGTLFVLVATAGCGGQGEMVQITRVITETVIVEEETVQVTRIVAEEVEVIPEEEEAAPAESEEPTEAPVSTAPATVAGEPTRASIPIALATIDAALTNTMEGSIAHNAPEEMDLDTLVEIELLISPSSQDTAPAQLAAEVTAPGPVVSNTLQVTPWMRAELNGPDPEAFHINPLHAESVQLLSNLESTRWQWTVQARKPGVQRLFVTVYRLVQVDDDDNWRTVETYRHDMLVRVSWQTRLATMWTSLRDNIFYQVVAALLAALLLGLWSQRRSRAERTDDDAT